MAMASSIFRQVWVLCAFFFLLADSVSCIPSREFDSMLDTLRERGYDLFCNAILTSDLQFEVLSYRQQEKEEEEQQQQRTTNSNSSRHTFTFFAPTDASLFALDMTQTASSYTDTLRFHVVPRRLSVAELRLLPEGYGLPTLLPQRRLDVMRSTAYAAGVSVGGVEIAYPGLFYGRHVAVHGLSGILSLRSNSVSGVSSLPPSTAPVAPKISSQDRRWRSIPNFPENQTVLAPSSGPVRPVPKSVTFNITIRRRPHPPVVAPAPGPIAVSGHSPAPVPNQRSGQAPAPVPNQRSGQAPAPVPNQKSAQAPTASPVNKRVDAPAPGPEADWMVNQLADSPLSLGEAPVVSPAVSDQMFPDSEISFQPNGFSYAEVPAPAAVDLVVREDESVTIVEESGGELEGVMETTRKSQELDGVRKCDVGVGVNDHVRIMQCNAS